uniref:Uncharacterized protein n=1 Tax=Sinocyclocheilus grahami TaxID=75366 RepID=A0A672K1U0_SINGR
MFLEQANQISGLRNDLLTPAVRFNPCVTPFPGPSPPMESSDSCLGFTTPLLIAHRQQSNTLTGAKNLCHMLMTRKTSQTCSNQSELVFLIPNFLFFHISSREEKSHHPLEELVHELNGEWYHIYLQIQTDFLERRGQLYV